MDFLGKFKSDESGSIIIMFALMLSIMVGIVTLSLDVGSTSLVKSKLQQASDAAAISAALQPRGTSVTDRDRIARKYFRLNFPDDYMGSGIAANLISLSYLPDANNPASVAVSTSGALTSNYGHQKLSISGGTEVSTDSTQSAASPADIIFVLDFSSSMKGSRAKALKNSMYNFSAKIFAEPNATQNYQVGIVSFAKKIRNELLLTNSQASFNKVTAQLTNSSGSHVWRGLERARNRLLPPPLGSAVYDAPNQPHKNSRKIVIVETDGGTEGGDIIGLCKSMHENDITIFVVMIAGYSLNHPNSWWHKCAGNGKDTDVTKYLKPGGNESLMTEAFIAALKESTKMRIVK